MQISFLPFLSCFQVFVVSVVAVAVLGTLLGVGIGLVLTEARQSVAARKDNTALMLGAAAVGLVQQVGCCVRTPN